MIVRSLEKRPEAAPVKSGQGAARSRKNFAGSAHPAGKAKPVRDSFTMPQADYALIDKLKERALAFRRPAKKSELLRAGRSTR